MSQPYLEHNNFGDEFKRVHADSELVVPNIATSGYTTLSPGLVTLNPIDNILYFYNGTSWQSTGGGSGTVTNISTTSPITGGPISTTGTIGITKATISTDGYLSSTDWNIFNNKGSGTVTSVTLVNGTGINLSGTNPITTSGSITITNSAPDQTVVLTNGSGISITGAYPNFTITNTGIGTTYSAGTGLTLSGTTFSVNTSQNINRLSNLTTNGFVKTTGGTGALSIDTNTYLIGNQTITLSSDVTGTGTTSIVTIIANNAVTYAKMQNVSTTSKLLGSSSTTTPVQEISIGSGLTLSGTTISASGAVSSVSNVDGTLTISPTIGSVIASLNLGHANTWSAVGNSFTHSITADGLTLGLGNSSVSTNTALGVNTLAANTTGTNSVAVGYQALLSQTTAGTNSNTAVGSGALLSLTTGFSNTAIGAASMQSSGIAIQANTAIGHGSLGTSTGSFNTGVGFNVLNSASFSGVNNVVLGYAGGQGITSGSQNFIGAIYNGATVGGAGITTGNYNTVLGGALLSNLSNHISFSDGQGNIGILYDASGGTPASNLLFGWDNTDGKNKYITIGTGLNYDHTTHTLSASGTTGVTSVSGTLNRITSTGGTTPIIDISASYVGQGSITTVGAVTSGTWQANKIQEVYGGTNQSSYTTGDILYASATNTLSKLAIGSIGNILGISGGVPVWQSPATSGTVTSIATNNGITGGIITSTGTIGLAAIAATSVLANTTLGSAAPSSALGYTSANTASNLVYRDSSGNFAGSTITATTLNVNTPTSTTGSINVNGELLSISNSVSPITLINPLADFEGSANNYMQINIRNASSGTTASTDLVVTADNGTDTTHYLDMGINSSGFSLGGWTINGPTDGYFYSQSDGLSIGTAANKPLNFFTGGTLAANERLKIDGSGNTTFTLGSDTTGDIFYRNSSGFFTRLPIGTTNQVLKVSGGLPVWGTSTGGSSQLPYVSNGITNNASIGQGLTNDLITGKAGGQIIIGGIGVNEGLSFYANILSNAASGGNTGTNAFQFFGSNGAGSLFTIGNGGALTIASATISGSLSLNSSGNIINATGANNLIQLGTASTNVYLGVTGGIVFANTANLTAAYTTKIQVNPNAVASTNAPVITLPLTWPSNGQVLASSSDGYTYWTNLPSRNVIPKVTSYNSVTTAGNGLKSIVASNRVTGQTAANASITTYTITNVDSSFTISANIYVTTSSAENFTMTCAYTDENNNSRTQTMPFILLAGTTSAAIAFANGAVPYEGVTFRIRCKASTTITIATTGTFTGVVYNAEADITWVK